MRTFIGSDAWPNFFISTTVAVCWAVGGHAFEPYNIFFSWLWQSTKWLAHSHLTTTEDFSPSPLSHDFRDGDGWQFGAGCCQFYWPLLRVLRCFSFLLLLMEATKWSRKQSQRRGRFLEKLRSQDAMPIMLNKSWLQKLVYLLLSSFM